MTDSQQQLLRTILTGTPGFLVLKNKQLAYEVVNPAFCQFLAKGPDEIVGKKDADLFPKDEAAQSQKEEKSLMKSGVPRQLAQPFTGKDGQHWFEVTRSPVLDEDGDPAGLLLTANDITEFKRREESVEGAEGKLQELQTQANEAAAERDAATTKLQQAAEHLKKLQADAQEKAQLLTQRDEELQQLQADAQEKAQLLSQHEGELQKLQADAQEKAQLLAARDEELAKAGEQLQQAQQLREQVQQAAQAAEEARGHATQLQEQMNLLKSQAEEEIARHEQAHAETASQLEQLRGAQGEAAGLAQQLVDKLQGA